MIKHGDNKVGEQTKLYRAWANMKCRIKHPTERDGENYKNISYCQEWEQYLPFKEWALSNGYKDHLTLDREDVYGNYEPSNCRWVSQKVQQRNKTNNKMVEWNGKIQCLSAWAEELGIERDTLKSRILRGWTVERAFTEPMGAGRRDAMYKRKRDEKGRML